MRPTIPNLITLARILFIPVMAYYLMSEAYRIALPIFLVAALSDLADGYIARRYRLHTIDVFVRPELAHAPSALRTVRGLNIAHASGYGMDWLAVSDVSADVLTAFVQRLAQEAASP